MSAYICMYLRGALQICPKPVGYQLPQIGCDPVGSNRRNLFVSLRRLVRSHRSLDATVENPFALEAPITQWLYKHLKERLRFWSEAGAMEESRR